MPPPSAYPFTHTSLKVLNIQQLLIPVITKEKVKLVENAQQDAVNSFMTEHASKFSVVLGYLSDAHEIVK